MAKYEKHFRGNFDDVLELCENAILNGSLSASLEDGSNIQVGDVNVAVRVFERYSVLGKNRVSLNLTLVGQGDRIALTAITSGGSQAVLFKINVFGEEAFLDTLSDVVEEYLNSHE